MHLQITICYPYLQAIRPCFQNNWVKVSLNFMEYFCGLCVCVRRLCMCMLVHMKRLQEDLRCSALLVFAYFLETGSLTDPRLVVSTLWFSSVCPLKHWGYIGMAAPNVRKNLITIILGGGSCAHASWFFLSIFSWAMRTEQVATLSASTSVYMDTGNLNSGLPPWVLSPAFPAPHGGFKQEKLNLGRARLTQVVLWDRYKSAFIIYLTYHFR